MKTIFFPLLLIISITANAQLTNCNREVSFEEDAKLLPKEVCIPEGDYFITRIRNGTDVNQDGLEDFLFNWHKKTLQDGDTFFITIYTQNPDSTFTHFRTFPHLFPINFDRYDSDYTPKNKSLVNFFKKYGGEYPLTELTIQNDSITLRIYFATKEDLIITYCYDKEIKNWAYKSCILYGFYTEPPTEEPYDLSNKLGPTIDNFTFIYWDEEEDE